MSDERTFELVSAAADGELDDAEQAELDRLLETSPGAGRFRTDLGRLDAILRKVPDVTPPETLHDRIMTSVSLPAAKSRAGLQQNSGWFGGIAPFAALRYGIAAAAGLVVAAAFYESQGISDSVDVAELVGSMAPDRERNASDVVDSYAFHAEGINSQVSLERRNGKLLLDIRVDAEAPVDISVNLASAGARLEALAQTQDSLESIEIIEGVLRMRATGRRQLSALLGRSEDAGPQGRKIMQLEFSSEGRLLQRGTLTPAW